MFHVNKKVITIIAAGLACISITACKDTKTNTPESVTSIHQAHFTFVEHGQEAPTKLESADKQIIYISSSAEKVAFVAENRIDRPSAKKINDVLTQAYNRSKDRYNSIVDQLDAYLSDKNNDTSTFPWETTTDYTCVRNDSKAISVVETVETRTAGVLSGTTTFAYNFNPANGDFIGQVFYDSNDKASFDSADDLMYKKLVEKYGEDTINYENVASSFVEMSHPCWYFTDDGVHVIFNAGSIANAEAGVLELDYTKEELPEFAQKYFN